MTFFASQTTITMPEKTSKPPQLPKRVKPYRARSPKKVQEIRQDGLLYIDREKAVAQNRDLIRRLIGPSNPPPLPKRVKPYRVRHIRLVPADGTCTRVTLGTYDVEARDGKAAIRKARARGAMPMEGIEYLEAAVKWGSRQSVSSSVSL